MQALSQRLLKAGKSEVLLAAVVLTLVIVLAFRDVVFAGHTLLTSNIAPGTAGPAGAYGYPGPRVKFFPVLDPGASAWQYEPYVKALRKYLTAGWLPLWNPYMGCGTPLLANMASAALFPLRLLLAASQTPAVWDFYLLLRLFLAAFFTFLLARALGIGLAGSLIAGIAFSLCGHLVLYVNMTDLDVQIVLPALLLAVDRLALKPNYRTFVVTVFVAALVILGGMPASALFIFFFVGLYFLVRAWPLRSVEQPRWPHLAKQVTCLAAAGTLGLLISLPLILPFLEYLQHAFHPRGGVGLVHSPIQTAISLVIPHFFFGTLHKTWLGISSFAILPYVGCACSLLAIAALCRRRPLTRLTLFFAGFSAFYLLKAYGVPSVQWLGHLPLFSMSIFPKHAFPEFALSVALLAGMGAEALLKNNLSYRRLALGTSLLCLFAAGFTAYYWDTATAAGAQAYVLRRGAIFLSVVVMVWLLAHGARHYGPAKLIILLVVLLPTAELISYVPHERTQRYDTFTKPLFIDFLKTDSQPYRVYSSEDILYPNTAMGYDVHDIRTLEPILVARYMDFLRKHFSPEIYDRFIGSEPGRHIVNSRLLDLMNVKYVLSSVELRGQPLLTTVLQDGFVLPTSRWGIGEDRFVIDQVPKRVLFQHPPSRIDYETELPAQPAQLHFALGLHPNTWGPDKGDGVSFQVDVTDLSAAEPLFAQYVDPKNRPTDRKWHLCALDLSRYRNQEIYLIFQTLPGAHNFFDWAHWAPLDEKDQESLRARLGESQIIAPEPNYVGPAEVTIGDRRLKTWLQHPPATVRFRLRVPAERPTLRLAFGLEPAVWEPGKGDGVQFAVLAAPVHPLFAKTIDPKNNPQERKWHPASIDLAGFRGRRVLLSFHTLPQANNAFDWAGWGDLSLQSSGKGQARFDLVYDHEIKIYRNNDVLPRAFIVHQAEIIPEKDTLLARLAEPDFNPRTTVLLEESPPSTPTFSPAESLGASSVTFERYEPNRVRLRATLPQPGFLVLTDAFYPGWRVRVDGRKERILAADYIFRAVSLPAGSHVVEFVYLPASFLLGLGISVLTAAALLGFPLVRQLRAC